MEEQVLEIIKAINGDALKHSGKSILEDGIIDSFELMEIISNLEETFDIEFDSENIISENFATVDTIINLVKKTLEDKGC